MNKKGFTIIELLVVIAVFSVLIYVLTAMLINIAIAPKAEQSAIEQIDQARAVSNKFINEIRSAINCAGGASPISKANDFEVIFCIDSRRGNVNPQLDIDEIRYYKTEDTLYKGVTSPTFNGSGYGYNTTDEKITTALTGLVSNASVTTPAFYYYDDSYDGATGSPMPQSNRNMASIQFVRINLPVIKQKINPSTGVSLSGWSHRKKITIDSANVDTDLADFPLYVKIANDSLIGASAQPNGNDIRFTDSTGTILLPYERENFSVTNGTATAGFWVKIPTIYHSPTGNQNTIYIYYGNLGAQDGQDTKDVWSSYAMAYHLDEPTGTSGNASVIDNTGNTSGTPTAGILFGRTGKIGTSVDFSSGTGINLGARGSPLLTAETTISFWIYENNYASPSRQNPFNQAYGGWGTMTLETGSTISWFFGNNGGDGNSYSTNASLNMVSNSAWNYITATRNPAAHQYKWYKNGLFLNGGTYDASYPVIATQTLTLGKGYVNALNGKLDEFRISSTARTPEWIKFEYYNMNDANADLTIPLTDETLQSGNFLEYSTENSFTITGGATIRSLRSANSFGQ